MVNLDPGGCAESCLEKKVCNRVREGLTVSCRLDSADDMIVPVVVDRVGDHGSGEAEIGNVIQARSRSRNAMAGIAAARRCVHKLDYEELLGVVDVWVDTALSLGSRDIKLMQRLVSRQNDLRQTARQDDGVMARSLH